MYVAETFVVQVPTNLNEEAKEALRKFDEACGNRPKSKAADDFEKPEKKKKSFMDKLKERLLRINYKRKLKKRDPLFFF